MKKIILLLNEYPYNAGEYSFIKTELPVILNEYEVTIISFSHATIQKMQIDERIRLYHCNYVFGVKEKFLAVFNFFFSLIGIRELIEIIKGKEKIIGRMYDSISFLSCANQLRRFMKIHKIIKPSEEVLIYSYWFNANCMAFLQEKKKNNNLKVISRIHGYDLYNERNIYSRQPFRNYMDKHIDKLFFVGRSGKEYYLKNWGKAESSKYIVAPIGTVNDGVNNPHMLKEAGTPFRIVSCSDIIPLKRVDYIIKALSNIQDVKMEWIHFGTGELLESIKQIAAESLGENIKYVFRGGVPVEEIMHYYSYNYVDCFITTSETEGCPISVQEAMSYGIPVIATAVGEIPNMIQGNGVLLSANPLVEEISLAIRYMITCDEENILKMRSESKRIWKEKYNACINAAKFLHDLEKEII